jgi:hypothetical protein
MKHILCVDILLVVMCNSTTVDSIFLLPFTLDNKGKYVFGKIYEFKRKETHKEFVTDDLVQ